MINFNSFFKFNCSFQGYKQNKSRVAGFSFIDVIIGVGLLIISFLAIYGVFNLSIGLIGVSKAKVGALESWRNG